MSKYRNSGEGEQKRKFAGKRGEHSERKNTNQEANDKKKKDGYKAKRSYTKNKMFRELGEKRENDRARRPYKTANRKPFKRDFGKEDKFAGFKKPEEGLKRKPFEAKEGKRKFEGREKEGHRSGDDSRRVKHDELEGGRAFGRGENSDRKKPSRGSHQNKPTTDDGLIRLNKYLSNAGVASRRDADNLIQSGAVKVNGVVVDQLGYKIKPTDKVTYGDASVKSERKVYLLLNKPKDYITTTDDPRERKTVMELVAGACRERIYPVGRLDRNTTGLLLFTNDGELAKKLTHPKYGIKKVYQVSLNKGLRTEDFKAIIEGLELEDGIVKVDDLAFVGEGKKEIGIEIHSGRNRVVRRIFEHLGYDVLKLDRVVFAGLTKKDLPRGKHRFLTAKEVSFLQMIG